jgi:hypothetical protein
VKLPRELAGLAAKLGKTHFQSTEVVSIEVPRALMEGAASWKLLNVTGLLEDQEGTAPELAAGDVPAEFGLVFGKGFALLPTVHEDKMQLTLFAKDGGFFYGQDGNTLKFVVDDDLDPRFSLMRVTLQDFTITGFAATAFPAGGTVAAAENGVTMSAWLNVVGPASTAANGVTLTTGTFDMLYPR